MCRAQDSAEAFEKLVSHHDDYIWFHLDGLPAGVDRPFSEGVSEVFTLLGHAKRLFNGISIDMQLVARSCSLEKSLVSTIIF